VVVQPVPQDTLHVPFESQLYVTSFAAPPSAPPAPNVQLPPVLQPQVLPSHAQSPVQTAVPLPEGVLGAAPSEPASAGLLFAVSPPHPSATPIPASAREASAMSRRALDMRISRYG
jgi:hypothetical protein